MKLCSLVSGYFQNRIILFCLPVPTVHSYICERFTHFEDRSVYYDAVESVDRSWEYINCPQAHECRIWDWNRAIPFLGMQKLVFWYSVKVANNTRILLKVLHVTMQVDLRHADEKKNSPVVDIGIDLSEFYQSVEWDILEVPAERYLF